jgi:hypothetical protein
MVGIVLTAILQHESGPRAVIRRAARHDDYSSKIYRTLPTTALLSSSFGLMVVTI